MQGLLVSLLVLGVVLSLVFTRVRPILIFAVAAGALYLLNLVPLQDLSANYVNPSLLTLVMLLLLSVVLEKVSFISLITRCTLSGNKSWRGVFQLLLFTGGISALLNNTAVVATMMGGIAKQRWYAPSRLLLPLSYASIAGGMITLVGTSTNLIVNSFVQQAGLEPLGFFDFTWIGVPVFLVVLLVLVFISSPLLPDNKSVRAQLSRQDYFFERRVMPGSSLAGRSVRDNQLRQLEGLFLTEVVRNSKAITPVTPGCVLEEGDLLVFSGDPASEHVLQKFDGLMHVDATHSAAGGEQLAEVVVSPSSTMVGYSIKSCEFRSRFDAAVVAIRKGNKRVRGRLGDHVLQAGDSLLLAVNDDFFKLPDIQREFIAVSGIERKRALTPRQSLTVMLGFALVIGLSAFSVLPLLKGLLLLLGGCLAFGAVRLEELKSRFPFEIIVVVGGALALSQAMFSSGLAAQMAQLLGSSVQGLGAMGALVAVYLATWLLTEVVTNNAAAALMFPLAYAVAESLGISPYPFFMALAFGASASFLSPYGYQTNLMVYSAGDYALKDYLRAGFPVLLAYSITALLLIPVFFPLTVSGG